MDFWDWLMEQATRSSVYPNGAPGMTPPPSGPPPPLPRPASGNPQEMPSDANYQNVLRQLQSTPNFLSSDPRPIPGSSDTTFDIPSPRLPSRPGEPGGKLLNPGGQEQFDPAFIDYLLNGPGRPGEMR